MFAFPWMNAEHRRFCRGCLWILSDKEQAEHLNATSHLTPLMLSSTERKKTKKYLNHSAAGKKKKKKTDSYLFLEQSNNTNLPGQVLTVAPWQPLLLSVLTVPLTRLCPCRNGSLQWPDPGSALDGHPALRTKWCYWNGNKRHLFQAVL